MPTIPGKPSMMRVWNLTSPLTTDNKDHRLESTTRIKTSSEEKNTSCSPCTVDVDERPTRIARVVTNSWMELSTWVSYLLKWATSFCHNIFFSWRSSRAAIFAYSMFCFLNLLSANFLVSSYLDIMAKLKAGRQGKNAQKVSLTFHDFNIKFIWVRKYARLKNSVKMMEMIRMS